jgi:hypothetical protein
VSSGSWPYIPGQCPDCHYFCAAAPAFVDDSGYEIVGFCRHPRIAMELFRRQRQTGSATDRCPVFVARLATDHPSASPKKGS